MRLTRRGLLRTGSLGAGLGLPGLGGLVRAVARAGGAGTTLAGRIVRGAEVRDGYRRLRRIGGEAHLVRTDLGVPAASGRASRRTPLSCFVQISDVHIIDAQSPLRVEFLDRLEDNGPAPRPGFLTSAYRPQEILTAQVADAMVRRINAVGSGPVSGRRIGFAIQTGDNSDNSQYNEVRWNIRLLDGAWIRPDSGDPDRYEGVMDGEPTTYDRNYWHPHGTPPGKGEDYPRRDFGFPVVKGLLAAARRPFQAAGLDMPWYTAFGNHDGLVQGNMPANEALNAIAVGGVKVVGPLDEASGNAVIAMLDEGDLPGVVAALTDPNLPAREVTPDPRRRLLSRKQVVEAHFDTSGLPVGHGFTEANKTAGTAYYAFTRGILRVIVLDTVNPNGYADGSLDATQFAWLQEELAAATSRLVVVCSHHTSQTMDNVLLAAGGDPTPRVRGSEVVAALLAQPNVIAWVNGHTHVNAITAHPRPGGGGFWEIQTASHVDWPQHARVLEVLDNHDGTLSIFGTLIDHASPASYAGDLSDPAHLASLARELAANDWQRREVGQGPRNGRNVELLVGAPAWL